MKTATRFVLVQLSLLTAGFASPGFDRLWQAALSGDAAVRDPRGIAGPWEGQWESQKNGHTGALRCLVTPVAGGKYEFHYRAVWAKVMKGSFRIVCEARPGASGLAVKGSKSLGIFGTYHHEGKISPRSFEATFRSDRKNLGSFRLKRPEGWKPPGG